jgi:hypothetical protein
MKAHFPRLLPNPGRLIEHHLPRRIVIDRVNYQHVIHVSPSVDSRFGQLSGIDGPTMSITGAGREFIRRGVKNREFFPAGPMDGLRRPAK